MKKVDKILFNARIYTMESEGDVKQAVAIKDGKFVALGDNDEIKTKYQADEIIDLENKVMLPGMGDSHMHFYAYCQTYTTVDLSEAKSKAEAIELLKEKAENTPDGEWIKGSNFDQSKWNDCEDELPTRFDLDKAGDKNPIVIKRVCLHTAVANTMALKKANIGKGFVFGKGGLVELDEDGMPNGILREQAPKIYDEIIPDAMMIPENKERYIKAGLREANSYGITMLHTYAAKIWQYIEDYDYYLELNRRGELPLRMTVCIDDFYNKPFLTKGEREDPYRCVQYGTFKIFCDGSLGSRSAKLYEPYDDDPTTDGILVITQEELNERMLKGYEMGLQPAIHCIGDKGLDNVVTAIEYTLKTSRERGMTEREQSDRLPFRIIHAQMATPELIERMSKLPVVLDIQPSFFMTDLHWIKDRVGEERANMSYTWKKYRDAGLTMAGGSDSPVEIFSPWEGIYSCVARKDKNHWPPEGVQPDEKLSRYDSVAMYCKNVAIANGEEDLMGTIEVGKFADFCIIDRDIFEINEDDILNIQVLNTYLAGKEVYRK